MNRKTKPQKNQEPVIKAAIVEHTNAAPVYGDYRDPPINADETLINVQASALTHLVRGIAAGKHYTTTPRTPFIPGVDGVGRLDTGETVYFFSPSAPFGAMAEYVALSTRNYIPVPQGIDPNKAAALANPGMSSTAALRHRAQLKNGETVLINGATGVAGRLAVQIAKRLGAGNVIVTGRNRQVLERLKATGADTCIALSEESQDLENAFVHLLRTHPVDIVLDYLWGDSMNAFFAAVGKTVHNATPIRVVQIGSISASTLPLPASVLRSSGLVLMGSGIGSVPMPKMVASVAEVFRIEAQQPLEIETEIVPLSEVETHWNRHTECRVVFRISP